MESESGGFADALFAACCWTYLARESNLPGIAAFRIERPVEVGGENGSDDACIAGLLSYYATNGLLSYKLSYDTASLESDSFTSGTEYIALAFGYDATISTGLFKKVFTAGEIEGTASAAWRASLPQKRPGNPLQVKSLAEMLQARD